MPRPMPPPSEHERRARPERVVIEAITPQVDSGRFAAKGTVGAPVTVAADVFTEGHDLVAAEVRFRSDRDAPPTCVPMEALGNDRFVASIVPDRVGRCSFAVVGWIDRFETWRRDTGAKTGAGLEVSVELLVGLELVEAAANAAEAASSPMAVTLAHAAAALHSGDCADVLDDDGVRRAMRAFGDRSDRVVSAELAVDVDRARARWSTWYELFPRSTADEPGRHGTLADCRRRLPYVAELGFDVVYLPPIHPIGAVHRKGANNALEAGPDDPGSPWAIGSAEGGHDAIHPALGTTDDLRALVADADALGMEIALDLAFQCAPDHPWVRTRPEWFRHRPDGTIQYAENPPKRYEDIYPLDFECDDWPALWQALRDVVEHWIGLGVRVFRVDNPHTKPFRFWEWLIDSVKRDHPDVLFLAEAFTRPKVMYHLAKLGFSQSYTYFAWRQEKWELQEYLLEITRSPVADFFRPCFWPNTPDILTEQLQVGTRPVFVTRLVLAATLVANYGIYGPAFELMEHVARPGSEEYLDNEKYQLRSWDLERPDSLRHVIARVNAIRRRHPALQQDRTLRFHRVDNDALVCWSKSEHDPAFGDPGDVVLVVVNLDPDHVQSGFVELDLGALGFAPDERFQVHDELGGARYRWHGARNYVELDPSSVPAHVFAVRRPLRTERDFEYFA